VRVHKEALLAMKAFWHTLTRHEVTFTDLADCVKKIDEGVIAAEKVYR
jgi:hypothetical protein